MSAPQQVQDGSRDLAVVQPTPLPVSVRGPRLALPSSDELAALRAYGDIVFKSGICPAHIKSPEAAIVCMRYGHQLGIDEFTAVQNMFVQGGRVAMFANLQHALMLRDHGGDAIQVVESTKDRCEIRCRRRDRLDVVTISYTFEEARQAKLTDKDIWKQYPADMLFARCIGRASRQLFRDSTLGLYTPEEVDANYIEVEGQVIQVGGSETDNRAGSDDDRDRAMRALHAEAEGKASHQVLHDLAAAAYGVVSMTDCTNGQLRGLQQVIAACAISGIATVLTYAREIDECRDLDCLAEISGRVATDPIPQRARDFLTFIGKRVQDSLSARPSGAPIEVEYVDVNTGEIVEGEYVDAAAIEWRDRVESAQTDTDTGRAAVALGALITEAGDDPARWDVLLALSPTQNRLNQIRQAHLKTGAKTDERNVETYQRRMAEIKAKGQPTK